MIPIYSTIAGLLDNARAIFAGPPTAPGYQVSGTQVTGAQQPPVADADGTLAGATNTINALVRAMRQHGAVVGVQPLPAITQAAWYREPGHGNTWQDTAGSTPAVADADPVARWDDASGLGHHLLWTGAPTTKPTLKLALINGRNIVRTNGTADSLRATFTLAQPSCTFGTIRPTNASYAFTIWDGGIAASPRQGMLWQYQTLPQIGTSEGGWATLVSSTAQGVG